MNKKEIINIRVTKGQKEVIKFLANNESDGNMSHFMKMLVYNYITYTEIHPTDYDIDIKDSLFKKWFNV